MTGTTVARLGDVHWRAMSDRVVVLSRRSGQPIYLEGTAAMIWWALGSTPAVDDLVEEIASAAERRPSDIREEIDEFLRALDAELVIEWR